MSAATDEDLARVTVISPTRRIDLALPGAATLGEVLPGIVRFSGYEGGAPNETVHQWVLQRFGEDPLDPTKPISQLEIRDGETLHLRQLEATMPDVAFDDVVDAVATSTTARPSWTPRHSRGLAIGLSSAFIVLLPAVLLLSHRSAATAILTLGIAVAAVVAAFLCSRAYGRPLVAAALGWQSVALVTLGGYFLLGGVDTPIRLLASAALLLLFAGVIAVAAQVQPYAFASVALAALAVVIAAMVAVLFPERLTAIAAVTMAVMLATMPLAPSLCYRLARIATPDLPTSAEELSHDNTPVQSDIVARAIVADRLLAAMVTAAVLTTAVAALPVLGAGTWRGAFLCLAVSLSLLLRARAFVGLSQRLVLLLGGSFILLGTMADLLTKMDGGAIRVLAGAATAVLLAVVLSAYAAAYSERQVSPFWGRMADIVEWLAVIAIIPLALWVLEVYSFALGLNG